MTLQVRAGESVNNYEITRFAQLFNDELTLDNLERIQLVNLCRFVGIPPFGTDAFLASRLRAHLARIKVRPDLQHLCCFVFPSLGLFLSRISSSFHASSFSLIRSLSHLFIHLFNHLVGQCSVCYLFVRVFTHAFVVI